MCRATRRFTRAPLPHIVLPMPGQERSLTQTHANRGRIAAFLVATFLYWGSLYIYVPTLPAYVKLRASSLTAVGIVLSMYGLWEALVRIPLGVAVDATGRSKASLVLGFLLAGAGALIMALGGSMGTLAFGRALTGVSSAAWVPMIVVFAAFYPPERAVSATALISLVCSLGQMLGALSTGFLNNLGGYGLTFYVATGLAVASAAIVAGVPLVRPSAAAHRSVSARSILSVFARRDVLMPSLTNAVLQFGCWAVLFSFLPLLAKQLGAGAVTVSLILTVSLVSNAVATLFLTLAAQRGSKRGILFSSFVLFAGGIVVATLGRSIGYFFLAAVMMGGANGLFYPILMGLSIEKVDSAHRSTAMGIHQAVYAVGMFTGPWVGGVLADALGIRPMFGITAGFCLVASCVLIALHPWGPARREALSA
jgi:predicted MFS family arabinose efflux permease